MELRRKIFLCLLSLSVLAAFFTVPVFAQTTLDNPLGEANPQVIMGRIIRAALGLAGSLALLVFIFGGLSWITAAGKEEKIQRGKDMMFWASVGLAVIFFSYSLVLFVINALTAGSGANSGGGSGRNVNSSSGSLNINSSGGGSNVNGN